MWSGSRCHPKSGGDGKGSRNRFEVCDPPVSTQGVGRVGCRGPHVSPVSGPVLVWKTLDTSRQGNTSNDTPEPAYHPPLQVYPGTRGRRRSGSDFSYSSTVPVTPLPVLRTPGVPCGVPVPFGLHGLPRDGPVPQVDYGVVRDRTSELPQGRVVI